MEAVLDLLVDRGVAELPRDSVEEVVLGDRAVEVEVGCVTCQRSALSFTRAPPMSQRGGGTGIVFRTRQATPMPSPGSPPSSTTLPGRSHRPSPCSRMHPVPTVPEPRTSQGTAWCSSRLARRSPPRSVCRVSCPGNAPLRSRARPSPRSEPSSSSAVTSTGPRLVAKSLPFAGPSPTPSLALEIACRPVVHDREASDLAVRTDHGSELELVVELLDARTGTGPRSSGPVHRRVRSSRPGYRTFLRRRARIGAPWLAPYRSSERVEVADRRRPQHRRQEAHLVQPVLRMLARLATAREERLQRLCGCWITRSPSMRPGQPRGRSRSSGRNRSASVKLVNLVPILVVRRSAARYGVCT